MRPVRRADNLTTFKYRLSWNLGASASWNHQGLSRPVMELLYYPVCHITGIKHRVLETGGCVHLTLRHCACVWVRLSTYWKCGVSLKFSPMATCCPRSEISSQLSRLKITINRYCIQCSPPTCATSPRPSVSNWLHLSKKGKMGLLDDYLFGCSFPVICPTNFTHQ